MIWPLYSPVPCYPPQSPWPSFLLALHFLFPLSGTSTASPTLTPNPTKGIFIQMAPSHLTADNPSLGRVPQSFLPLLVTFTTLPCLLPSYYSLQFVIIFLCVCVLPSFPTGMDGLLGQFIIHFVHLCTPRLLYHNRHIISTQ